MKRVSIKMKVTLWYTLFMSLLAAALLGVLISLSSSRLLSSVQTGLKAMVLGSLNEIEWDEGDAKLDIDDDLKFFNNGSYLAVYNSNGYLLEGMVPDGFPDGIELSPDKSQQVQIVRSGQGVSWYVCDYLSNIPGYGNIWIRGVASQSDTENAFHTIVRLSLILFPVMILCIALGGYYITKRAFGPIRRITETADEISRGSDLSKRIHLADGGRSGSDSNSIAVKHKDEVYLLADTFDGMLSRLERQFEKEKQFTSDVSHELRTPLSVILSQCEYGLKEERRDQERGEALIVIMKQSQKMARLISQLLTLSRADSGKEILHLELVNVSELLNMVVEEQREKADANNIEIKENIQQDILLRADETLLMRFFINLVSNGLTYGKEGGWLEVSLWVEADNVRGYIRDNGIGIAPENLNRIWDRFYQAESSRTSGKEGGAGLGLPMVRWIGDAHNAKVWAESKEGQGSTFHFSFPINN